MWKNNKGFSLTEVTIAIALLGGIGITVAMLSNQMTTSQTTMSAKSDAQMFATGLTNYLMSDAACEVYKNSMGALPSASSPANLQITGFSGYGINANQTLASNTQIGKNLTLESLTVQEKPGVTRMSTNVNGVTKQQTIMHIKYKIVADNVAPKDRVMERFVEIPVMLEAGSVSECLNAGSMDPSDLCEMMNTAYDETTGRCLPSETCEVKGTFVEKSCSPSNQTCDWISAFSQNSVNQFTNAKACPAGSTPTLTYQFAIDRVKQTGKKSSITVTTTEHYWMCLTCPDDVAGGDITGGTTGGGTGECQLQGTTVILRDGSSVAITDMSNSQVADCDWTCEYIDDYAFTADGTFKDVASLTEDERTACGWNATGELE